MGHRLAALSLLFVGAASASGADELDRQCATACVGPYCNPSLVIGGYYPTQYCKSQGASADGRWLSFIATDESKERPWPQAMGVADTSKFVPFDNSSNETGAYALTYLPVSHGILRAGPFAPSGEYFWMGYENLLCLGYPSGMNNNSMDGTFCQKLPMEVSWFDFTAMSKDGKVALVQVTHGLESTLVAASRGEDGVLSLVATPGNGSSYLTGDGTRMVFQTDNKVCTGVIGKMNDRGNSTDGVTCLPIANPWGRKTNFWVSASGINSNGSLMYYGSGDNDVDSVQCVIDTQNGNSLCTEATYRFVVQNGMGERFGVFTVVFSNTCITDLAGATKGTGRVNKPGVLDTKYINCTQRGAPNFFLRGSAPYGPDDHFVISNQLLEASIALPTEKWYLVTPSEFADQTALGGRGVVEIEKGELNSGWNIPLGGFWGQAKRSAIAQWWVKHPTPALNATVGQICTQNVVLTAPTN